MNGFEIADDDGEKIVEVVSHAAGDLPDAFHLLGLTGALVGRPSFREITGNFRKTDQLAAGIPDRVDDDTGPESAFVLANPPSLRFVFAGPLGNTERPLRYTRVAFLRSIERREMAADDFVPRITLDPFGAGIPVDDVSGRIEHVDRIVGDTFHQQAEAPLGIFEFGQAGRELSGPFGGPLFKRLVQPLQFLFGLRPRGQFALAGLVEAGVVDRNGRLRRQGSHDPLGAFGENAGAGVPEEEPAQHLPRARGNRYGQIASHREMSLGHAMVRRAFPISGIGENVVGSHRPATPESGFEDRRVAWHRELFKCRAWRTRKRVERIGFPGVPYDVVEKRAELRVTELDPCVGDHLHQLFKVQLCSDRHSGPVEQFQSAGLLPDLNDARFQRFIGRKEAGFERLSLRDFEERPAEHGGRFADGDLALAGNPVQPPVGMLDPELGIECAGSACRPERFMDLRNVIDENHGLPA